MKELPTTAARDVHRGRRIKEAAQSAGITLRILANQLGIARPTIYAYVSGSLHVPAMRLQAIADVTGQPLEFFEQIGDGPGHWDGEMAVQHADALIGNPDCGAVPNFVATSLKRIHEGDVLSRARLLQRAGTARIHSGEYLEAIRALEEAQRIFGLAGRPDCQSDCSQSLGHCHLNIGLVDEARAAFEDALHRCDPENRWQALTALALLDERSGEFEAVEQRLAAVESQEGLSPLARVHVGALLGTIAANRGHWDLCVQQSLPVLQGAIQQGLFDQTIERMIQIGLARIYQGELEEASLWLIRATDAANLHGDHSRIVFARLVTATLSAAVGDVDLARRQTVDTLDEATRHHFRRSKAYARVQLARLARQRGDDEGALDAAIQAKSFCETHSYFVPGVEATICKARAMTALGDPEGALAVLDLLERDPRMQTLGQPRMVLLMAKSEAARSLQRFEDCDTADAQVREVAEQSGSKLLLGSPSPGLGLRAYFVRDGVLQLCTAPLPESKE